MLGTSRRPAVAWLFEISERPSEHRVDYGRSVAGTGCDNCICDYDYIRLHTVLRWLSNHTG